MPRQNRVTPFGEIIATPARGTLMGNRGCLHDASGRIVRGHKAGYNAWIYCLLEFKGRRRELMQPGRYTELFFLGEATALAAGHRPCAECQRGRYNDFLRCWGEANRELWKGEKLRAPMVDAVLQRERMGPGGEKVKWRAKLGELPVGCVVELEGQDGAWALKTSARVVELQKWELTGHGEIARMPKDTTLNVLTPKSVVNAIAAGFSPRDH